MTYDWDGRPRRLKNIRPNCNSDENYFGIGFGDGNRDLLGDRVGRVWRNRSAKR
jgi:hypothetical protein